MKKIKLLYSDKFLLIDDIDYERVNKYKWFLSSNKHITGKINGTLTLVHRFILNHKGKLPIDHINRNIFDNTRDNLRIVNNIVNAHNSKMRKNNTCGYKGVNFEKRTGKWIARIRLGGDRKYIGTFLTSQDASDAYQETLSNYLRGGIKY